MKKLYYQQNNIGKAKYTVSTQDGIDTHKDGSPFWGIAIFKNKIKLKKYIKDLESKGYKKRGDVSDKSLLELKSDLSKQQVIYSNEKDLIKVNNANWRMTLIMNELNKRNGVGDN